MPHEKSKFYSTKHALSFVTLQILAVADAVGIKFYDLFNIRNKS